MIKILCNISLSDWGDIFTIILGAASVFTAVVTAIVLCKQHKLQREQLNAQQLEHQPTFKIDYNENSDLIISCENYNMWSVARINAKTVLCIIIDQLETNKRWGYCLPIRYYTKSKFTYAAIGLLGTFNPILRRADSFLFEQEKSIESALSERLGKKYFVTADFEDLVSIKYKDIYQIERNVYFLDGEQISEDLYRERVSIAKKICSQDVSINKIDVETIVKEASLRKFKMK